MTEKPKQYTIPHDERHQFLDFDLRDEVFYSWCDWFDKKGVEYEVGGGGNRWTIYKHQMLVEDHDTGKISRCCPMLEEL